MRFRKGSLAMCLAFGLTAILAGCFFPTYPCANGHDGLCVFGEEKYVPPKPAAQPYIAENMTFAVSLDGQGNPIFSAPPGLRNRPYYIVSMFVGFPRSGGKSVWDIRGENRTGARLPDEMRFRPDSPIVYGKKLNGTIEVISPAPLKLGQRYVFFANLAYENESGLVDLARGTVGFTLTDTGNTPRSVASSRTRYDGTD